MCELLNLCSVSFFHLWPYLNHLILLKSIGFHVNTEDLGFS